VMWERMQAWCRLRRHVIHLVAFVSFICLLFNAVDHDQAHKKEPQHRRSLQRKNPLCPPTVKLCQDQKKEKIAEEKANALALEEEKTKLKLDAERREGLERWVAEKEWDMDQIRKDEEMKARRVEREAREEEKLDEEIDRDIAVLEEAEIRKNQLKAFLANKKDKNIRRMKMRRARAAVGAEVGAEYHLTAAKENSELLGVHAGTLVGGGSLNHRWKRRGVLGGEAKIELP